MSAAIKEKNQDLGIEKFTSSELNLGDFESNYLRPKVPVIITDAAMSWKAFQQWSPEYLKEKIGKQTATVKFNENGIFDYNENAETGMVWSQEMPMSEAIRLVVETEVGSRCYVQQTSLRMSFHDLLDDLQRPYLLDPAIFDKTVSLWFSGKKCKSPLHFDGADNFFVQIFGEKRFILFPPKDTDHLYPAMGKLLPHCSLINIFNPDLVKFPLFEKTNSIELIIKPGQMLYIPAKWWHAVESLSVSASVNYWW
jgi:hypothetical protein